MMPTSGADERLQALSTIACSVPPGAGGLGRNFESVIAYAEAHGVYPEKLHPVLADRPSLDPRTRDVRPRWRGGRVLLWTPLRYSYAWTTYVAGLTFDLAVARSLSDQSPGFTGFAGQSLASFRKARTIGVDRLALISPTSHVEHAYRQHQVARSLYPIDRGWLNAALIDRTRQEYELADLILINSEYQRQTFLEHGVADGKLVSVPLRVSNCQSDAQPTPPLRQTFNIVYVGRFDLPKGIPALLDAFRAAAQPHWRLTLQGSFCTWRIRRYMARRVGGDPRVTILPDSDPSAVLADAHVFVHPSFDDGYGLAPMEALHAGVPVIVTDMTGMSECVSEGVNGSVVPAGDVGALISALQQHAN